MQDVTNSTRVLCAPGGNSSLNLFGGDAPAAPAMVKKAPAPADESQTFGRRVIQHTEHMGIGDKRSTRVHAAPGGNSSLNLFGGEVEPPQPVRTVSAPMPAAPPQPKPQMQAAGGHMRVQTEHMGISDRCSSRVLAAPGGNSSLNLFGGDDVPQQQAAPARAPAAAAVNDSQTFGRRVIQHTEHMGIGDKRSTRVHAAPGGNSSLNLFGGEVEPPQPVRTVSAPMPAAPPQPKPQMQAAGGHMRVQTEHMGISDRCSSRVLAAPGGNSSLNLFGGDDAPPAAAQAAVPRQAPPPALPAQPQQQAAGGHMRVQTEHMGISDRSSSRVLAAPGGNSTIFLGDAAANGTAEDRMAALRRMRSA